MVALLSLFSSFVIRRVFFFVVLCCGTTLVFCVLVFFFYFLGNDTASTEIFTLSLHVAPPSINWKPLLDYAGLSYAVFCFLPKEVS